MGRADPGTVISKLLSAQKLVAPLAGSVNKRQKARSTVRFKVRDENAWQSPSFPPKLVVDGGLVYPPR